MCSLKHDINILKLNITSIEILLFNIILIGDRFEVAVVEQNFKRINVKEN